MFEPAGTFSRIVLVVVPVLLPLSKIVAPTGTELTEILPTADTAHGSNKRSNNTPTIRDFFFISDFPIVKTNKNIIAPTFDKYY